jgi:hypothetical protein
LPPATRKQSSPSRSTANRHTLRWVIAHMTGKNARHAGHADILREQLDGTTGR